MNAGERVLGKEGLQRYQALQPDAVRAVTERFYAEHGSAYEKFGPRGREACREDLAFHLEFLRPVLEFGLVQPMVDYLAWLDSVLAARSIPGTHVALSLDWLREFFADHMDPADGEIVSTALHAVRAGFLAASETPLAAPRPPASQPEVAAFAAELLAGRQREALAIVTRCLDSGRGLVDIELHIIQPALYQIGEKWQANKVSVAQEHMASAIVQSVMTVALLRSPPPKLNGKRALLACVEGNSHTIGLRMVADAFQLAGWEVQYLGANVPTAALVRQAAEWNPHLVGVSVSFPQQLRSVRDIIAQLDERLGSTRPAVILGGLAINRYRDLAGIAGEDAWRVDSSAAVAYANRTVAA